jgi:subtilisin-like proprotein convertase family protein
MRIGSLHVRIDSLIHPNVEDLDVFLFSPWGDSLELFTDVGGSGDNFIATILTDSAGARITAGTAPFTGVWKPEASNVPSGGFNVWEGFFGAGDWVLRIVDDAAPDSGRLIRWSLWIDPFSSEEIYISTITDFGTDTDLRLFKSDAVLGGYSGWDFNALTVDLDDDVEADLGSSRAEGNLLIVNTHVIGTDADIRYHASTDGGLTWSEPEILAAGSGNQWFPSVAVLRKFDPVPYNVAYLDGGDSVIVLESAEIGGLGAAPRRRVNDGLPSVAVRPEIGAHAVSSDARSHLVYARAAGGIYYDGEETATAVQEEGQTPSSISLAQNYPNPFNPSTRIIFSLTARSDVRLAVYDVLGREVRTLLRETRPAGTHEVLFDAAGLAGGVYYYTLRAGGRMEMKKMLLLR